MVQLPDSDLNLPPAIRRGRLSTLTIYEISDSELETLERGSPDSVFLNVGLSLLSLAAAFTAALSLSTVESNRVFTVFVIVTVVSYIVGAVLLLLWWRSRRMVTGCAKTIRNRLPPEGTAEPLGSGGKPSSEEDIG